MNATLEPAPAAAVERGGESWANAAWLLWWLVLALLPFGKSAELPMAIAAVLGVIQMIRQRRLLAENHAFRLAAVLFACYWLPILLAAPDAVMPPRSWGTAATVPRFFPAVALLTLSLGAVPGMHRKLRWAVAWLIGAWVVDAMFQAATGYDIRGAGGSVDRVSGMFGDDNLKLGPVLAAVAAYPLDLVLRARGRRWAFVVWIGLAVTVLVAGTRAGWLSFGLLTLIFAWRGARHRREFTLAMVAAILLSLLGGLVAYHASDRVRARIDRTLTITQGDEQDVDHALAGRLPIWKTALRMAKDHPINGVGARGFRYAYPAYADPDDPWTKREPGVGAAHPHQLVLELLTETGVPGLAAWIFAVVAILRARRLLPVAARERAFAPAVSLIVMCFPINTHFAFYSSYWALLLWWQIGMYCAALRPDGDADAGG